MNAVLMEWSGFYGIVFVVGKIGFNFILVIFELVGFE